MEESILLKQISKDLIDKIIINRELRENKFIDYLMDMINASSPIINEQKDHYKIRSKKIQIVGSSKMSVIEPLYVLSDDYLICRINKKIYSCLHRYTNMQQDDSLLINNSRKTVFILNKSMRLFLENFDQPNSLMNVWESIINDVTKNNKISINLKDFFNALVTHKILVSENTIIQPTINMNRIVMEDLYITHVLKKYRTCSSGCVTVVALASNIKTKEKVIVKFLTTAKDSYPQRDSSKRSGFGKEFRIMKMIGYHERIRSLISFDESRNIAVLEYVHGRSLKEIILTGKLKIQHKIYILSQIIEVLSFIHDKEIIHGDIHVDQFLVDSRLNIKLIDFGMSAIVSKEENNNEIYSSRGGVHYYLEPENILENAFICVKDYIPYFEIDIYRLGVLIYFLIYERYPFDSYSWKHLFKLIKSNNYIINRYTPKGEPIPDVVLEILQTCLSKNISERFNSAGEILRTYNLDII